MRAVAKFLHGALGVLLLSGLTGCTTMSQQLDPFYEPPAPNALLGEKSDRALYGESGGGDRARQALEAMASYRRDKTPEPVNPVIQPAVVRVMWIPDHLNRNGDLVPSHYYYLKVLSDRWAVQDAFELESQLHGPNGNSGVSSNVPYIHENDLRK